MHQSRQLAGFIVSGLSLSHNVAMIDVQYFRDAYRVSESTIIELAQAKPYVINRLVQKLIHNRLIESPYNGNYHTEASIQYCLSPLVAIHKLLTNIGV